MKLLIDASANVNIKTNNGDTALHWGSSKSKFIIYKNINKINIFKHLRRDMKGR